MVLSHRLHVWNSRRGPHLGRGHGRPHQQAGHMTAIASIRRCSSLAGRGPSTYGSRLSRLTALGRDDSQSGGASHMPYQRREIMSRVLLRLSIATLAFAAMLLSTQAQDWPTRPIRILVGFGAGGGTDLAARIVAQPLQEILGTPVVVENRVGAGGTTAANAVVIAPKDGYTALMMSNAHAIAPVIYKSVPYDSVQDFDMISLVGTAGLIA